MRGGGKRTAVAVAVVLVLAGCRPTPVENPRCRRLAAFTRLTIGASVVFGISVLGLAFTFGEREHDGRDLIIASAGALAFGVWADALNSKKNQCYREEQRGREEVEERRADTREQGECEATIAAWRAERKPLLKHALYEHMTPECRRAITTHSADEPRREAPAQEPAPGRSENPPAGAGKDVEEPPAQPVDGELGGRCVDGELCTGDLVCDPATVLCVQSDP